MRRPALALAVLVAAASAAAQPVDAPFDARVREAIRAAVEERIGQPGASVDALAITATPVEGPLDATPAPDARTGRPSLFSLTVTTPRGSRRVGSAMATVHMSAAGVRSRVSLRRGADLAASDVEPWQGPIGQTPLKRLPRLEEIAGARAARAIEPGTVLTSDMLAVPPSVRSGQQVRLRAVVDGIVAEGLAVATENARLGAVVRVVNPDSKRTIVGRVVGRGEVEVIHGS